MNSISESLNANQLHSSARTKENFLANAARNKFLNFAQLVDPHYQANWHHEVIAHYLEEAVKSVEKGKPYRLILEMPPRHGKSHTATTLFPPWALGKHPEWKFIVTSYSADLAQSFGQKARDIITANSNYPHLFPDTKVRKDSKAKDKWQTTVGGGYSSVGVGGSITGFGANIAIIDDPIKNREEADSETQREKIWDWYTSTLYTRLEGTGAIIVIMTRWHLDDLVGRLLEEGHDNWQVVRFPAIGEENDHYPSKKSIIRKKGEPLWKEKFPLSVLENIRKNIGVYDWNSLYQQTPILAETQEFRPEMIQYFEEEELPPDHRLRFTTTVDPATGGKHSDNTVITTVAKEIDGPNWYVVEETAGKLDPGATADAIFKHVTSYRSEVFIETVAYQKMLKWYVEEEQRRRQQYFSVHELRGNSRKSKEARVRGLIPLMKAGIIHFRKSQDELIREAMQFPKGKHDDRIDNLASQLEAVENTGNFVRAKVFKKKMNGYFRRK